MRGGCMKKLLITLTGLLLVATDVFALNQEQYTYTPAYINHLKACSKYTDEYTTNIGTGDENSPYLKVKSTEEILGYLNGKCYTKSTVYSYDLGIIILSIKCGLTKKQILEITNKMNKVNKESSSEMKKKLQDDLMLLIGDPNVCRVKNYLKDDNK